MRELALIIYGSFFVFTSIVFFISCILSNSYVLSLTAIPLLGAGASVLSAMRDVESGEWSIVELLINQLFGIGLPLFMAISALSTLVEKSNYISILTSRRFPAISRRLAQATSKPVRSFVSFRIDFPRMWKLFSFILGERTRARVFEPAHEDMLEQYYLAKRSYRTKFARFWLAIAFTVRTLVMVVECARTSAVDRAFGWVRTLLSK